MFCALFLKAHLGTLPRVFQIVRGWQPFGIRLADGLLVLDGSKLHGRQIGPFLAARADADIEEARSVGPALVLTTCVTIMDLFCALDLTALFLLPVLFLRLVDRFLVLCVAFARLGILFALLFLLLLGQHALLLGLFGLDLAFAFIKLALHRCWFEMSGNEQDLVKDVCVVGMIMYCTVQQ